MKPISLVVMALFYIAAGANHFLNPAYYLRIIPPFLPAHEALNVISGLAEIILGVLLLVPGWSRFAAAGLVVLLVAVFPANIYHFTSGGAGTGISGWILAARLPFQLVLIAWAYWHTH